WHAQAHNTNLAHGRLLDGYNAYDTSAIQLLSMTHCASAQIACPVNALCPPHVAPYEASLGKRCGIDSDIPLVASARVPFLPGFNKAQGRHPGKANGKQNVKGIHEGRPVLYPVDNAVDAV